VDIPAQVADKRLTVQNQYDLLTAGITSAINGFISRKTGQPFSARLVLNPEFRVVYDFNFKEPEKIQKAVFYTPPSLVGKHYHEVWD
jgi:hypothetical protein